MVGTNPHRYDEPVGLLKIGAIESIDPFRNIMRVVIENSNVVGSQVTYATVQVSYPVTLNNGLFIGAKPVTGTPVLIAQTTNSYYFIGFLSKPQNIPTLKDNELLLSSNDQTQISLNTSSDIYLGSPDNRIHINVVDGLYTTYFPNQQHFTESFREINGIVKRDRILNDNWDLNSRLSNDKYDSKYTVISLDPTLTNNPSLGGSEKNPAFVERREIVYEFEQSAGVRDDLSESLIYSPGGAANTQYSFPNRRQSKADAFSLTLASPNYLMETIKGTAVDIFGNLLDINRSILPVGTEQITLNDEISTDKVASFKKIKELERKGIAFHFEINARKDFFNQTSNSQNISDLFGYDNKFPNADYGRLRSRFYFDVDKEGQFKLNVPASSNKGNVPLLTRYENFTNISKEDSDNPDKLIFREDLVDILQDSFAAPKINQDTFSYTDSAGKINPPGSVQIKNGNAEASPFDRRYQDGYVHIKHGTAFHDVLTTCFLHQKKGQDFMKYQYNKSIDIDSIPLLENVVSDSIDISGDDPEKLAGGRSGLINFDGSIEMSIGANTIDRQSLWLDTAGGIVANIGRDKKNMSAAVSMDGNVFIQVGGLGVTGDSRFVKQNNGALGAVLDLRVFNNGNTLTMFRVDSNGITIMTPGNINIYASQTIKFTGSKFEIDVEECKIQGRAVKKEFGGSI